MTTPQVGDVLPPLTHVPSEIQLFRYSAVTWNSHRIHYDQAYARSEGYPNVLVQSHLHGAFLTRLCTDWVAGRGVVRTLSVSVRHYAVPGDVLVCRGTVTAVSGQRVAVDLREVRESDGTVCAHGKAEFLLSPSEVPATVEGS